MPKPLTDEEVVNYLGAYVDYDKGGPLVVQYHENGVVLCNEDHNNHVLFTRKQLQSIFQWLKEWGYLEEKPTSQES